MEILWGHFKTRPPAQRRHHQQVAVHQDGPRAQASHVSPGIWHLFGIRNMGVPHVLSVKWLHFRLVLSSHEAFMMTSCHVMSCHVMLCFPLRVPCLAPELAACSCPSALRKGSWPSSSCALCLGHRKPHVFCILSLCYIQYILHMLCVYDFSLQRILYIYISYASHHGTGDASLYHSHSISLHIVETSLYHC